MEARYDAPQFHHSSHDPPVRNQGRSGCGHWNLSGLNMNTRLVRQVRNACFPQAQPAAGHSTALTRQPTGPFQAVDTLLQSLQHQLVESERRQPTAAGQMLLGGPPPSQLPITPSMGEAAPPPTWAQPVEAAGKPRAVPIAPQQPPPNPPSLVAAGHLQTPPGVGGKPRAGVPPPVQPTAGQEARGGSSRVTQAAVPPHQDTPREVIAEAGVGCWAEVAAAPARGREASPAAARSRSNTPTLSSGPPTLGSGRGGAAPANPAQDPPQKHLNRTQLKNAKLSRFGPAMSTQPPAPAPHGNAACGVSSVPPGFSGISRLPGPALRRASPPAKSQGPGGSKRVEPEAAVAQRGKANQLAEQRASELGAAGGSQVPRRPAEAGAGEGARKRGKSTDQQGWSSALYKAIQDV